MADDLCFFSKELQDTFSIKSPKKSPLLLRMVVLMFVMISSVYICPICLKQTGFQTNPGIWSLSVKETPCTEPNTEPWEIPYVMCTTQNPKLMAGVNRSGSGWFETLLNNHTNISSNGEVFSVKVRRSNVPMIFETLDKIYNLDWLSSASKNECTVAVGLKWMLNQGVMQHHEEIVEYFSTKSVSAVFLFRRNLLRRMISVLANSYDRQVTLLNGTHKSHVHSHHEAEILARYKPYVNATLLIPNLYQVQETATKALEYFNNTRHTIVYYEGILKNHAKLQEVQDFLKVPQRDLTSRQVKIHKGSLSNQVENWVEVEHALRGTPYESILHGDHRR